MNEIKDLQAKIDKMLDDDKKTIDENSPENFEQKFNEAKNIINEFLKMEGNLEVVLTEMENNKKKLSIKYDDNTNPLLSKEYIFTSPDFDSFFKTQILPNFVDNETKVIDTIKTLKIANSNNALSINFLPKSFNHNDYKIKTASLKQNVLNDSKSYQKASQQGYTSAAVLALVTTIAGLAFTIGILVGVN